jgi:transcriptional regulator with XRE-family HTH domain
MTFDGKLKELRKQKNITQEELADALYVSRTAISKWESGRGYPNIESLKLLSQYFNITVDDLLSCHEMMAMAETTHKEKSKQIKDVIFGLLDSSVILFLFLPFYGYHEGEVIHEVSLINLQGLEPYIFISYCILVALIVICGVLMLSLQNFQIRLWSKWGHRISLVLSTLATMLFIASLQPYAAVFVFVLLIIKVIMMVKTK